MAFNSRLKQATAGVGALLFALCGIAHAAPQSYVFSTGSALSFGGNTQFPATAAQIADAQALAGLFNGSSVSGTFNFDAAVPAFVTNGDGSIIYSGNPNSSFMALTAQVSGGSLGTLNFSDPRGFTQVGNETQGPVGSKVDIFQMFADTQLSTGTHNISGFSLGAFSLYNARMFWIEGQMTPEPIPDLFGSSSLPGAPPAMHGRLALDFIKDGVAGQQQYVVFFDALSVSPVPEPETYAMLLAGLGLLGFAARRRKQREAATA